MAVSQNTLIGRTRGSVGGVTFSTWKGLNVLKGKAENVQQPNSDAQILQRNKMALMVEVFRSAPALFKIGFRSFAVKMSEFNAFIKYNINDAIVVTPPTDVDIDFPELLVAKGPLSPTSITGVIATDQSASVDVSFSQSVTAPDQTLNDLARVYVFNNTNGTVGYTVANDVRSSGMASVLMPEQCTTGDTLHAYLFFQSPDGSVNSDSDYFTVTV